MGLFEGFEFQDETYTYEHKDLKKVEIIKCFGSEESITERINNLVSSMYDKHKVEHPEVYDLLHSIVVLSTVHVMNEAVKDPERLLMTARDEFKMPIHLILIERKKFMGKIIKVLMKSKNNEYTLEKLNYWKIKAEKIYISRSRAKKQRTCPAKDFSINSLISYVYSGKKLLLEIVCFGSR